MAKGDSGKKSVVMRELQKSPTFANLYVNDTQVEGSFWDVRLRLGLIVDVDIPNNRVMIDHLADVRMSLQHAKKVAEILVGHIEKYEKRFGKIVSPAED